MKAFMKIFLSVIFKTWRKKILDQNNYLINYEALANKLPIKLAVEP